MRLPPKDEPRTITPKRWGRYQSPEEVLTPNETRQYKYQSQNPKVHPTHRSSADADAIMQKIMEFEDIVNVSQMKDDRYHSANEITASSYAESREGPPSFDRHSAARNSYQERSSSSGYSSRPSTTRSGSMSIPMRSLADAISPQESQNGSVSFFPPSSEPTGKAKMNGHGAIQTNRPTARNGVLVSRGQQQALGPAMAADFASFIKSPCKKLNSVESLDEGTGKKQESKIWDFLDPEEDVTPADRRNVIRKKRKEKRALEEAYKDLMLISPDKDNYIMNQNRKEKRKAKRGSIKMKGCGVTASQPSSAPSGVSNENSIGSQTDSSLGSSDVHYEMWGQHLHTQRGSNSPFTVASDIPQSHEAYSKALAFYPRTSEPYGKVAAIIKPSNLRRRGPSQQEYYPTSNELDDTPRRRVQFSKSCDPELHQRSYTPSTEAKQDIPMLTSCIGAGAVDDPQEAIGEAETSDAKIEKLRQQLWAAKLNEMFPKKESEALNVSSAGNCITGDLKQLEQTLIAQASEEKEKKQTQPTNKMDEIPEQKLTLGTEMTPQLEVQLEVPNRRTYMYIAYSRFSKQADEVLQLCELASIPSPNRKLGEVLVKVKACSISLSDCDVRRGARKEMELSPYIIPGTAFCGQIPLTEKKSAFSKIAPGDVVVSLRRSGSNARYVCAPKDHLVKVPPKIRADEAACLVETYLTAFQVLHLGRRSAIRYRDNSLKGRSILIMVGGFSSLSRALMETANAGGVGCCYVLVDKDEFEAVSKFGAIPLSKDPQQWLTLVGKQIDLLVACNDHEIRTQKITKHHLKALNNEGEVALIGKPGIYDCPPFTESTATSSSKLICKTSRRTLQDRCQMYNVFDAWDKDLKQGKRDLEHLFSLLKNHRVRPTVLQRLPLSKVAKAQALIETKKLSGHFVCLPWVSNEPMLPKDREET